MADLYHVFGSDLAWGPNGDIAMVSGADETTQRILRRLLTSAPDYIWHAQYGAGLGGYVGQVVNEAAIEAAVTEQMLREAAVAADPAPSVSLTSNGDGSVYLAISYVYAPTGQNQSLSFTVSAS